MSTTTARAAAKPAARKAAAKPKAATKAKAAIVAAPTPAPKPQSLAAAPAPKVTPDLFHDALARVLLHEGGRVNDPRDPGGRTNKGITQRVYSAWRARSSLPVRDVFEIADNEVEAIYRFQYWQPIHGDALPAGVGYVVFDGAVNSGPKQSVKWLQRALGSTYKSTIDGDLGNITLQAVEANPDNDRLIAAICERRMIFLQALKTWPTFRKGWSARVHDVLLTGQAWASASGAPAAEYREGGEKKAEVDDAKAAPPRAPGDIAAGGGGGIALGGGFLAQAREQLEPYAAKFAWVGTLVVWLVIIGIVAAVVGYAWRWWAARKKAALDDALDVDGNEPERPWVPTTPPPRPVR